MRSGCISPYFQDGDCWNIGNDNVIKPAQFACFQFNSIGVCGGPAKFQAWAGGDVYNDNYVTIPAFQSLQGVGENSTQEAHQDTMWPSLQTKPPKQKTPQVALAWEKCPVNAGS